MEVKDALELYENGKHRRYSLLFAVNGGAFTVAKIFTERPGVALGGLSLKHLAVGMGLFTALMVWDIFEFGRRSKRAPIPHVFGRAGKLVLISLGLLICAGWLLVGFGGTVDAPKP